MSSVGASFSEPTPEKGVWKRKLSGQRQIRAIRPDTNTVRPGLGLPLIPRDVPKRHGVLVQLDGQRRARAGRQILRLGESPHLEKGRRHADLGVRDVQLNDFGSGDGSGDGPTWTSYPKAAATAGMMEETFAPLAESFRVT